MRKLIRNKFITIYARKVCQEYLTSDSGRNYPLKRTEYSDLIPIAEWRYWVLTRNPSNVWTVIRARKC